MRLLLRLDDLQNDGIRAVNTAQHSTKRHKGDGTVVRSGKAV